jgi:polysaccharide export outer membrane protein
MAADARRDPLNRRRNAANGGTTMQRVASLLRRGAACAVAALAVLASAGTAAAQYRLGAGDRVRISVVGAAELSGEVDIDVDGDVRLPVFGAVPAAGLTVEELQTALRATVDSQVFTRVGPDGAAVFVGLEPGDVYASVVAYRPVYVTGAAGGGGGVVPFRPGLTVRSALASVGGAASAAAGGIDLASPRLQGEERNLSFEVARLVAELWRLEAEFAENPDPAPPAQGAPARPETFEALLANQRARLKASLAALERRRGFFDNAIRQNEQRLEILRKQQANQITAAEFDVEDQERVQILYERGIAPISRLIETRRAQLLSSTRLLETENNVERVEFEKTRVEGDQQLFEDGRTNDLLAAIEDTRAELETTGTRLAAVREELALKGQAVVALEAAASSTTVLTVYRDGQALVDVGPDLPLMPGDMVEVVIEPFGGLTASQ